MNIQQLKSLGDERNQRVPRFCLSMCGSNSKKKATKINNRWQMCSSIPAETTGRTSRSKQKLLSAAACVPQRPQAENGKRATAICWVTLTPKSMSATTEGCQSGGDARKGPSSLQKGFHYFPRICTTPPLSTTSGRNKTQKPCTNPILSK